MRKVLLAVVLLLSTSLAQAQPTLSKEHFVKNRGFEGYCAWTCLEMACLHHGHDKVRGLTDRRERTYLLMGDGRLVPTSGRAGVKNLTLELDAQKIKYQYQDIGTYDTDILTKANANQHPVVVSVRNYPLVGEHHAVLLMEITKTSVSFVDPNLDHKTITKTREWFDKTWTGYTVVVLPAEKPAEKAKEPPPIPPADPASNKTDGPPSIKSKAPVTQPSQEGYKYATPPSLGWTGTPAPTGGRVIRP